MTNINIDAVIGGAMGDEGKGKITHALIEKRNYTHCLRWNGGGNAGHTIYHQGKKYITHQIPSGVFKNIRNVIGPGCVINPSKLISEINYLQDNLGYEINLGIAYNTHLVNDDHITQDSGDKSIGTTKTGNGPAYASKYARTNKRAEDEPLLKPYLMDIYEEFYHRFDEAYILAEGAQAFNLDIDWGDYPYVTSSHCGIGGILNNGFNMRHVRNVYCVVKAYDTYVGAKQFQPHDEVFSRIQETGQEFGATTGRKRQVNWLDWNVVERAVKMNGVDVLFINKADVLDIVGEWGIKYNNDVLRFSSKKSYKDWIRIACDELAIKLIFSEGADDLTFVDHL